MQDIWMKLKQTDRPVLIYGMGDGCDKILSVCRAKGIPVAGIFASDDYAREKTVHGYDLMSASRALSHFDHPIALLAFGVFRQDLMAKIRALSERMTLYAPEVPLFGGGLFDLDFYNENKERLDLVRGMLADEDSVNVFDSLVEYKLTGEIGPLFRCESEKIEDLRTLVPYKAGDIYMDLGAYDGDTVLEWHNLHPDHGEILALEPNPKTFAKLCRGTAGIKGAVPLPWAAWNKNESLSFNGKSGRSAALDDKGTVTVQARRIDSLCDRADFIKFDVEGAEREAIAGAEGLIRSQAPSLCISAYHRTEDLIAIPLQVKKILPSYRVYLRHSPYIPPWDTLYYFIAR